MSNDIITQSNNGFMIVESLAQATECAKIISRSGFCPKSFQGKPDDVLVALQMGSELGLKPMQALQNIAIINGKPSLYGDAMIAVCRQASNFEYIHEEYDEKDNSYTCRAKRKGEPEVMQKFSEKDARLAKLWGKQGPWSDYPKRMLQMRARGFALRDCFPDLLRGIVDQSEASDYPAPKDVSPRKEFKKNAASKPEAVDAVFSEVVPAPMEDTPFLDSDLNSIRMALEACKTIDDLRSKAEIYKKSFQDMEIRKTIAAMSGEIYNKNFKEKQNHDDGSRERNATEE